MSYLSNIELHDRNSPPPTPEIEQERKVAIFDLLGKIHLNFLKRLVEGL